MCISYHWVNFIMKITSDKIQILIINKEYLYLTCIAILKAGAHVQIAANWKMLGYFNFLCSFHIWVSFLKISYNIIIFNKF